MDRRTVSVAEHMAKIAKDDIKKEFDRLWFNGIMVLVKAKHMQMALEGYLVIEYGDEVEMSDIGLVP